MPLYDYACDSCGHRLEVQQKLSEDPLTLCPNCQGEHLRRLISATAFVLKGGGWYKDGYSGGQAPQRTENDRSDRLQKAIDDDKKKSAPTTGGAGDTSSASGSSTPSTPSSGGGGDKSAGALA